MHGLLIKLERELKIRNYSKILRHSSIKNTQIYTQISQAQIKKVESPLDRL